MLRLRNCGLKRCKVINRLDPSMFRRLKYTVGGILWHMRMMTNDHFIIAFTVTVVMTGKIAVRCWKQQVYDWKKLKGLTQNGFRIKVSALIGPYIRQFHWGFKSGSFVSRSQRSSNTPFQQSSYFSRKLQLHSGGYGGGLRGRFPA